jgi:hypothetical protein
MTIMIISVPKYSKIKKPSQKEKVLRCAANQIRTDTPGCMSATTSR